MSECDPNIEISGSNIVFRCFSVQGLFILGYSKRNEQIVRLTCTTSRDEE